jgi:DHA2 family multidrug resistance protein
VLQGFSGGTLIPLALQIILKLIPEKDRHVGLTIFGLTVTLAPTLGPSLGGWLTDSQGWRAIFFINLIPGLLMLWSLRLGLEDTAPDYERLKKIDLVSFGLLALGLSTLTYILEEGPKFGWLDSHAIRIAFVTCIITLPAFIVRQFETKNPLLKLDLFKDRNFAFGTIITAAAGCALFSGIYALSLYLGQVQGYPASEIGKVLMWVGFPQLLVMPFLPFLMKRVNLKLLAVIGMLIFAYSNYLNTSLNTAFSGEQFRLSLLIRALGQPLFVIPLSVIAMGFVKKDDSEEASAIFNMMRNLGASFGIAMTTTMVMGRQAFHQARISENISQFDFHLIETMFKTENAYKALGLDAVAARTLAAREYLSQAIRDSLIMAFSDIFWVVGALLIFCTVLIVLLKNVKEAPEDIIIE